MSNCIKPAILLAVLLVYCDGRVVRSVTFPPISTTTKPTPSPTPSVPAIEPTPGTETAWPPRACIFEKYAHCPKILVSAFVLMFSPASTASVYSNRLCRSLKDYTDCVKAAGPSCEPLHRVWYKGMCEYEGTCRLADTAAYCMASYGPITANICRHLREIDTCATRTLQQAGCTSKNMASALWTFLRLLIGSSCYFYAEGLDIGCMTSNSCFTPPVATLISGIVEANHTKICRYTKTAAKCFQANAKKLPTGQCDSARQYYQNSLQLLSEMNAYCSQCTSNGNVYKVVPNTQCSVFSQSVIGQSPSGTHACPLGTMFDVDTCVCNFAASVTCVV